MKIKEKLKLDCAGLIAHGPITIVAFGDSVTHGALYFDEIDYDTVYHRLLAKKISAVRNYVPVNVVNAGIGGLTAVQSLERMDAQVFAHNPDLVIIAFGLNDVNRTLEEYVGSLRTMFEKCLARDIETVFLTPNMLNTYVADDLPKMYHEYASKMANFQNNGRMDTYIDAARALAHSMGVKVADCYAKWRELSKTQDTTVLLANRINHPTREMHELFADTLFDVIFDDEKSMNTAVEETMYRE
ncbi:MAG: SGNH/GDSL hydrolase family protein [Clostridia bacterium]|nr:SGNH/GDSL hydrolase family protein [Clostridia bacterium]